LGSKIWGCGDLEGVPVEAERSEMREAPERPGKRFEEIVAQVERNKLLQTPKLDR